MKRFDKIVEEWATLYKPIQHTPGESGENKRFFLFDSIVSVPQFIAKIDITKSPCVGFEFHKQGNIVGGKVQPVYTIYFMVNAGTDSLVAKEQSSEAVYEAETHAHKFLAWINEEQENRQELRNIDLQNVTYDTYGPLYNNWYAVFIQFRDVDVYNTCVDKNDYVK